MKIIILLTIAIAVVTTAFPQNNPDASARVLQVDTEDNGSDGYRFGYKTSNNIERDEVAKIDVKDGLQVEGSYKFIGDDGNTYHITYTADKNGYNPILKVIPGK